MSGANLLVLGGTQAAVDTSVYVEDVFSTYLYTGNGSNQTITNNINLSGKDGLIWWKARSGVSSNLFQDTVRGITKVIRSNNADAETTETTYVTSVSTTGFDVGTSLSVNNTTYATWTFRKQQKFFDIVTYTGNGSNRTISHNLGSVPGCIIVKRTSTAKDWAVYHRSVGNTKYLTLNATSAAATVSTYWNDTDPTSTVFTVGTDGDVNANGETYVAYLFAHDAGGFGASGNDSIIYCGSYTGNGGTTSPNNITALGFEPQWILLKPSSAVGNWAVFDTMRNMWYDSLGAAFGDELQPNGTGAEANGNYGPAPRSTGFGVSGTGFPNVSGTTYIYIAIRRGPMKTPSSSTSVFDVRTYVGNGTPNRAFTTNTIVDINLTSLVSATESRPCLGSRMSNGMAETYAGTVSYEDLNDWIGYDKNNGFTFPTVYTYSNESSQNYVTYSFSRAPKFCDVLSFVGNGANRTITHNLTVAPEFMIVTRRESSNTWAVYVANIGNTKYLTLSSNAAEATGTTFWNSTSPTSTEFSLGTSTSVNASADNYIVYMFASLSGISKIGSYTGTGTTKQIDCGFTNGVRFVWIKRTDSTGDWYVYDSSRGIVTGNDPYFFLNSSAAEVTNTDYVDTYSAGFELSSTAPAGLNANGGSYIFLAIA